ncbi:MAG: hypothetical protein AABP62_00675 [Planctomycetota bacterium]
MLEGPKKTDILIALPPAPISTEELKDCTDLDTRFREFSRRLNVAVSRFKESREKNALANEVSAQEVEQLLTLWCDIFRQKSRTKPSPQRVWTLAQELGELEGALTMEWQEDARNAGIQHLVGLYCRMTLALAHWFVGGFRFLELTLEQRQSIQNNVERAFQRWIGVFAETHDSVEKHATRQQFWLSVGLRCTGRSSRSVHFSIVADLRNEQLVQDVVTAVCNQITNSPDGLSYDRTQIIGGFLSDIFPKNEKDASEQTAVVSAVQRMLLDILGRVGKEAIAVNILDFLVRSLGLDRNDEVAGIRRESLPQFTAALISTLLQPSIWEVFSSAEGTFRRTFYMAATGRRHCDDFLGKNARMASSSTFVVSRKAESFKGEWPPHNAVESACQSWDHDPHTGQIQVCFSVDSESCYCDEDGSQRIRFPCTTVCALEDCGIIVGLPDQSRDNELQFVILKKVSRLHPLDFESSEMRSRLVVTCRKDDVCFAPNIKVLADVYFGNGATSSDSAVELFTSLGGNGAE